MLATSKTRKPSGAVGGVEVLAAQLQAARDCRLCALVVLVGLLQLEAVVEVALVVGGVRHAVQVAADHRLRLVPLGHGDAFEAVPRLRRPRRSGR